MNEEAVQPDEVQESGSRTLEIFMDSYQRGHGRTLDEDQVADIAEKLLDMAQTIEMAVVYTNALETLMFKAGEALGMAQENVYDVLAKVQQGELSPDEVEFKKSRFWTP